MRDTREGGAATLLKSGRPNSSGPCAQLKGSIRSMSASPAATSGSLSHPEIANMVFTGSRGDAIQGPVESARNREKSGCLWSLGRQKSRPAPVGRPASPSGAHALSQDSDRERRVKRLGTAGRWRGRPLVAPTSSLSRCGLRARRRERSGRFSRSAFRRRRAPGRCGPGPRS